MADMDQYRVEKFEKKDRSYSRNSQNHIYLAIPIIAYRKEAEYFVDFAQGNATDCLITNKSCLLAHMVAFSGRTENFLKNSMMSF